YNINYIYIRGGCQPGCPDTQNVEWPWVPHCAYGRPLASIAAPADLIAVVEGASQAPDIRRSITDLKCARHNNGSNYIFADGHAAWKKFSQTLFPTFLWDDGGLGTTAAQRDFRRNDYRANLNAGNNNLANCR